ncbi:hypothetical protein [Streptomyces sp. NPDC056883]|uniref:hypothetical protein n=1 Tax=Streptomyces sp. NPDC056883 TaxID=3345959 RepID=UPI0036C71756
MTISHSPPPAPRSRPGDRPEPLALLRPPGGLATAATAAAGYGVVLLTSSVLAIRFVRGLTAMQIAKAAQGPGRP